MKTLQHLLTRCPEGPNLTIVPLIPGVWFLRRGSEDQVLTHVPDVYLLAAPKLASAAAIRPNDQRQVGAVGRAAAQVSLQP